MSDAPDPLVPAEVNLHGFSGFMLNVDRLLASELVALGTPEECWAALLLWSRAWKQSPPASLPDDDKVLAAFSGAGKRWGKIKAMALRGFVKCSDGRLYHRVLAEEAMRAWKKRKAYETDQERLKRWRDAKRNGTETCDGDGDETRFKTGTETSPEPERQGSKKEEEVRKNANTAINELYPEKPVLLRPGVKNFAGFCSENSGSGAWSEQENRDNFAVTACIPHLPGRDDGERWALAMAAEDPTNPGHSRACLAMRKAAKAANVGWVSPERRPKPALKNGADHV